MGTNQRGREALSGESQKIGCKSRMLLPVKIGKLYNHVFYQKFLGPSYMEHFQPGVELSPVHQAEILALPLL